MTVALALLDSNEPKGVLSTICLSYTFNMYGYTRSLGRIGDSSSWMIYVVHYRGNIHLCHDHWSFSSPAICSAEPPTVVVRHSLSETRLQAWLKLRRQAKLEKEVFCQIWWLNLFYLWGGWEQSSTWRPTITRCCLKVKVKDSLLAVNEYWRV